MKIINTLAIVVIISSLFTLTNTGVVSASFNYSDVCNNQSTGNSAVCSANSSQTSTTTTNPVTSTIGNIINVVVEIAGIIAVIIIIISGVKYATAGGDPNKAKAARNNLIYALVGLVVIVLSDTVVVYVVNQFKG